MNRTLGRIFPTCRGYRQSAWRGAKNLTVFHIRNGYHQILKAKIIIRRGRHPAPPPLSQHKIPPERLQAFPGEFFYARAFAPLSSIPLAITAVFPLSNNVPGSSHACHDDQRRANYHICLRPGAAGPRQLSATA